MKFTKLELFVFVFSFKLTCHIWGIDSPTWCTFYVSPIELFWCFVWDSLKICFLWAFSDPKSIFFTIPPNTFPFMEDEHRTLHTFNMLAVQHRLLLTYPPSEMRGLRTPSYITISTISENGGTNTLGPGKHPKYNPELKGFHEPFDDFEKNNLLFQGGKKIKFDVQCQFQEYLFSSLVCWTFGVYMLGVTQTLQWVNNNLFYFNFCEVNIY